ncbi:hypothetical protein BT93_E1781 [Corymbia citriodora subsp. variegata]|nr:hypothetical protein BT93_E1781 [Corymbia citriodora subsp. variegata]
MKNPRDRTSSIRASHRGSTHIADSADTTHSHYQQTGTGNELREDKKTGKTPESRRPRNGIHVTEICLGATGQKRRMQASKQLRDWTAKKTGDHKSKREEGRPRKRKREMERCRWRRGDGEGVRGKQCQV